MHSVKALIGEQPFWGKALSGNSPSTISSAKKRLGLGRPIRTSHKSDKGPRKLIDISLSIVVTARLWIDR